MVCKTVISVVPWGEGTKTERVSITGAAAGLLPHAQLHTTHPPAQTYCLHVHPQEDTLLVSLCVRACMHRCVYVFMSVQTLMYRGQRTAWNVSQACTLLFEVGSLPGLELSK